MAEKLFLTARMLPFSCAQTLLPHKNKNNNRISIYFMDYTITKFWKLWA
jgi:hypothetical protein